MQTSGELVRLLMRTGYWSVWHGLYAEAAALFNGAKAARPERPPTSASAAMDLMAWTRNIHAASCNHRAGPAPFWPLRLRGSGEPGPAPARRTRPGDRKSVV